MSSIHTGLRIDEKTSIKITKISDRHKIKQSWLLRYLLRKGLEHVDMKVLLAEADVDINSRLGKDRK